MVYTGYAIRGASTVMCGLNLPLSVVSPESLRLPRLQGLRLLGASETPPWFPPSLVLLMLFPLPGMLFPPVYGNPTPHSSFKGSAQKAHSPRSCLPSPLCKCGINCIFLLTSVALSPLSPPRPLDHSHSEVCLLWQVIRSLWRG